MEININCDLGETSKFCSTENDPLLLGIVNSANVACGYHAGDEPTMKKTVEISKKNGVSIGAHPSFNDPENFGRKRLNLTSKEINKLIIDQINILSEIAEKNSMKVTHVKPHGALNNMACEDFELASIISKSIIKSCFSGSIEINFCPSLTSIFFNTLINFRGSFCSSTPAALIASTKSTADPSIIGISEASTSTKALSIPSP